MVSVLFSLSSSEESPCCSSDLDFCPESEPSVLSGPLWVRQEAPAGLGGWAGLSSRVPREVVDGAACPLVSPRRWWTGRPALSCPPGGGGRGGLSSRVPLMEHLLCSPRAPPAPSSLSPPVSPDLSRPHSAAAWAVAVLSRAALSAPQPCTLPGPSAPAAPAGPPAGPASSSAYAVDRSRSGVLHVNRQGLVLGSGEGCSGCSSSPVVAESCEATSGSSGGSSSSSSA